MKSPPAMVYLSFSTLISFLFYGLAITCLTSATVSASIRGNETDYLALLSFKEAAPTIRLLTTENSSGLEGSLSPHVGNMSFLRMLHLGNNSFHGTIPHELGRLSRLRGLYLYDNKFNGVIPTNLSGCSNLEVLSLARNKLVGSIPNEMSLHSELSRLVIHDNKLTGGIPPFLGNITSMEVFSARRNPFGGSIPDTLGLWKSLREFYCSDCNLYGSIPHSIFNLSLLVNFTLADNHLTGSLPSEIGVMLPNLEFLQLRNNELTGVLPPFISNFSKLEHLEMSNNNFSGKLTIDFSKLRDVYIYLIRLSYNNFNGRGEADDMINFIDQGHGEAGNLSDQLYSQDLGYNQLFGSLPSSIGPIPHATGNLSLLTELYLFSNKLEGHIPSSFGKCKELNGLGLGDNRLIGKIPKQLLQLPSLTYYLALSHNNLSGSIPSEIKNLKMLSGLNLSYNNLSVNITSSLGECIRLAELYLSGNIFEGIIPPSLSSLGGLEVLNISQNILSGKIHQFLEKWKSLEFLNLSFNDFEGEVPVVGVFANASLFSVLGNNRLCGGLVTLDLPKCKEKGSKKKKIPFFILVIVVAPTFLIVLCCVYLLCTKKRNSQPSQSSRNERFLKVSYNELLKATDGFSTANLIGEGRFSLVYKGILHSADDRLVAVKVLDLQNQGAHKSFLAECEAWRNIRHRNLLKIITSCSSVDLQGNNFKALVYEFMPNGSLHDWLHSTAYTSKLNLPSNILLDDDLVAHVGDFGLARLLGTDLNTDSSTGVKGTIGYAPPEYGIGSEMTICGDVYSFGILLLEVMTGKKPTDDMFNDGLSLHKFAYMALLDHVIDVIDGDAIVMQITEANAKKVEECLAATMKIGVSCSLDSPPQRLKIEIVVNELQHIVDVLQNILGLSSSLYGEVESNCNKDHGML
ncbi:kinase-like domain-containing protein [Tanacetum coccineum]